MNRWLQKNFGSVFVVFAFATLSILVQAARQLRLAHGTGVDVVPIAVTTVNGQAASSIVEPSTPSGAASVILLHNAFESAARASLDDEGAAAIPDDDAADEETNDQAIDRCPGGARLTVSLVDQNHPERTIAVLSFGADRDVTRIVRIGTQVYGKTVVALTARRVFLRDRDRFCFVDMSPATTSDHGRRAARSEVDRIALQMDESHS